jgi:hypothetical protein
MKMRSVVVAIGLVVSALAIVTPSDARPYHHHHHPMHHRHWHHR